MEENFFLKKIRPAPGVVLLMALYAITIMSLLFIGVLWLVTTDLQISTNYLYYEQALFLADAGIEDALTQLRQNHLWSAGFSNVEFPAGSGNYYTVTVTNNYPVVVLNSTGTVRTNFVRQVAASVNVTGPPAASPYVVRVDYWREL
jgi:Tfp pilus assembly protein PilX